MKGDMTPAGIPVSGVLKVRDPGEWPLRHPDGRVVTIAGCAVLAGVAETMSEARRLIEQGGLSVVTFAPPGEGR